jgi:hypothetical protein
VEPLAEQLCGLLGLLGLFVWVKSEEKKRREGKRREGKRRERKRERERKSKQEANT